jgi:hypothetical protein
MMKKGVLLIAFLLVGVSFGYSQVSSISQAQTLYIYNFSRMIQWPAGSTSGDFVIGVVGDNELFSNLTSYVTNKKVGTQPIVVRKFDDPQSVTRCHIVFVGDGKVSRLNEIVGKLQGANSLIITERKGMINSGSAIDFFMDQDKLRFVMNSNNAQKYNLTVSKSLEDMAYKN